jgi:hypothetical protein
VFGPGLVLLIWEPKKKSKNEGLLEEDLEFVFDQI